MCFTRKTVTKKFLIFIDKNYGGSLEVNLFEFLIRRLQAEKVDIHPYSFYREPLLLSSEKADQRLVPVDRIAQLYPETTLIIFSDASAFFRSMSTELEPWALNKFRSWENKMIITPIPFKDWDYKQRALRRAKFTIVPADLNAFDILINEINNLNQQRNITNEITGTYSSRFVKFNEWQELKDYLGKDEKYAEEKKMLIQWVASLAVYSHIDWNVTVALGKAIEENDSEKRKLVTYTNLLKLSRIEWLQTGILSDRLRFEMLKQLDEESQRVARVTMVSLFDDVGNVPEKSLVAEEVKLNKTVNKFLLHTYTPDKYELKKEEIDSVNESMKRYTERKWLGWSLKKHLDEADRTLLKNKAGNKSITPSEYFGIKEQNRK